MLIPKVYSQYSSLTITSDTESLKQDIYFNVNHQYCNVYSNNWIHGGGSNLLAGILMSLYDIVYGELSIAIKSVFLPLDQLSEHLQGPGSYGFLNTKCISN